MILLTTTRSTKKLIYEPLTTHHIITTSSHHTTTMKRLFEQLSLNDDDDDDIRPIKQHKHVPSFDLTNTLYDDLFYNIFTFLSVYELEKNMRPTSHRFNRLIITDRYHRTVDSLSCTNKEINTGTLYGNQKLMIKLFNRYKYVTSFNLSENRSLTNTVLGALFVSRMRSITKIDLNNTPINYTGVMLIANNCPKLQHLSMAGCMLHQNSLIAVRTLLQRCTGLISLNLSNYIPMSHNVISLICKHSTLLEQLNIDGFNRLTDDMLFKLINNLPHLQELHIKINRFANMVYNMENSNSQKYGLTVNGVARAVFKVGYRCNIIHNAF